MNFRAVHILCEEFRPEERKKVALLGVFTGEKILLGRTPGELPKGVVARLASLCVVTTLFGVPGTYRVKSSLRGPENFQVLENSNDILIGPEGSHTLVAKIAPFELKAVGRFVMRYAIDDSVIEFPFTIQFEEPRT